MIDRELRAWLALCRRLPNLPRAAGIANHLARRVYLRQPRGLIAARVEGFDLELDPADLTEGLWLFAPQLLDRAELAFLRAHLRPGDTFADLGAHVGRYALHAARWVGPYGRVLAVEPDARSHARLRTHLLRNHLDVVVRDTALGAEAGEAWLRHGPASNRGSSSLLDQGEGQSVRVETLVQALGAAGISRLDAAKLDLEGSEFAVLSAYFASVPHDRRPRALVVERHPDRLAGGDVGALLADAGYRFAPAGRFNLLATRVG